MGATTGTAFTFGEATAATGLTPSILGINTLATSTSIPLTITNAGASKIAMNITAGGIAFGGTNVMVVPYAGADTVSFAVGSGALANEAASGLQNTAVGYQAGQYISTGAYATAVGYQAMEGVTGTPLTGSYNTAFGDQALYMIQGAAADNTSVGEESLKYSTTGAYNTAVGSAAMFGVNTAPLTGSANTGVGYEAISAIQGATSNNTALGAYSLEYDTTGGWNTAVGEGAMNSVSGIPLTGNYNTAVGADALQLIQGATANDTAIGQGALQNDTTGQGNTAVGTSALQGAAAMTGNFNTGVGKAALAVIQGAAANNTALGSQAGFALTAATDNTLLGYTAGSVITTGGNNVFIGSNANAKAATDTNEIVIGAATTGMGSNSVVIGNGSITDVYFGMTTTCTNGTACGAGVTTSTAGAAGAVSLHASHYNAFSDVRLKRDIRDSDLGLDFIEKLRPVSYYFKAGKSRMSYGFIAQEVEQALDRRPTSIVTRQDDAMKTYELDYSELIAPTVKAIQQLKSTGDSDRNDIAALKKQIMEEQAEIADLLSTIKRQQREIDTLKSSSR